MSILYKLCLEFFKLGLFSYGGGLAILALLQDRAIELGWLTSKEFADVVAISQSTPGPIAVNMATFVGFTQAGLLGSVMATFAVILPGTVISIIIAKFMAHFNEEIIVKAVLRGLRAVVIGLLAIAIINIAKVSIIDLEAYNSTHEILDLFEPIALILFGLVLFLVYKYKKHPFFYIIPAGIVGMLFWH